MELTQLQYFRTVARTQNISRASKILHVTQPALSRSISNLEEELGAELFIRVGNRISISPCGISFLSRIDCAFHELDRGIEELHTMTNNEYGTVNLATFTPGLITTILEKFLTQYPSVHLVHTTMDHDEIKNNMESGAIDIALTMFPVESSLTEWTPLTSDELIALVNCDNPISRKEYLTAEDLKAQRLVLVESGYALQKLLEGFCSKFDFKPNISYIGCDNEVAMSMVRWNNCVMVLPAFRHVYKVEEDKRQASRGSNPRPFAFRGMRIKKPSCTFQYGLCIPKNRTVNCATQALYVLLENFLTSWSTRYEEEGLDNLVDM